MKISVRVKPGAREEKVEEIGEGQFAVWVREPPIEGRANRAVMDALARHWGVASSRVFIVSGHASRQKVVEIV